MNALTIAMFILTALSLRSIEASMVTPCSVKAKGVAVTLRFICDAVTICDRITKSFTFYQVRAMSMV
ncbi:MAG: hypothetical protein ABL876_03285 [Chitinophagaceae bacterium]